MNPHFLEIQIHESSMSGDSQRFMGFTPIPGILRRKRYSAAAYEVGYADLSRSRLCVSWPSGLLCGRSGRLTGQVRRSLARNGQF